MANEIYLQSNDGTLRFDMMDLDGFCLETDWESSIARELEARPGQEATVPVAYAPVTERFDLYANVTDEESGNIHVKWRLLLSFKEMMRRYRANADAQDYVWLYVRTDQGLSRSLVQKIDIDYPSNQTNPFLTNGVWYIAVTLVRHPFWENPSPTDTNLTPDTIFYYKYNYNGGGDVIGRISKFEMDGTRHIGSMHQAYYAGWRRGNRDDTDGWVWYWDFANGTNGTDTTDTAATGSRSGTMARVSFATNEALVNRSTITLSDSGVTTDLHHNRGTYLLLLRYAASGGSSISYGVRAKYTGLSTGNYITGNMHYIDGETTPGWRLLPLDVVSLPWGTGKMDLSRFNLDTLFGSLTILLEAERFGASGNLDLDSLWFIPYDNHIVVEDIPISLASWTEVQHLPDDRLEAISLSTSGSDSFFESSPTPISRNWGVPNENGSLVVLLDNKDQSGLSVDLFIDAAFSYHTRSLFIR